MSTSRLIFNSIAFALFSFVASPFVDVFKWDFCVDEFQDIWLNRCPIYLLGRLDITRLVLLTLKNIFNMKQNW